MNGLRAAVLRRTLWCWWRRNWAQLSNVHVQPEKPKVSCVAGPAGQVRGSAPLLSSSETAPGTLHPALGFAAQEGHGPVGMSPEEGHQVEYRDSAFVF